MGFRIAERIAVGRIPRCEFFRVGTAIDKAVALKGFICGAARRYVRKFGIATECGMARARSEETVRALLKIHAEICQHG
jgi:hypothetical protein